MDRSNSLATAWIDGKPHKLGLYVVEWLNGGGLYDDFIYSSTIEAE